MKPLPDTVAQEASRLLAAGPGPARPPTLDRAGARLAGWWPQSRLGEGLEALARRAGLSTGAGQALGSPPAADSERARWMDWAADQLDLELLPIDATVPEVPRLLRQAGPALLPLDGAAGEPGFVLLLSSRRGRPNLLGPDGRTHRCPPDALRAVLCQPHEAPLAAEIAALLAAAAVPAARRGRAQAALLRERLATARVGPFWMLRLPAGSGFWRQLTQARLPQRVAASLALLALLYALEISAWRLIGGATLDGRLDHGWLVAWLLLMLSMLPLRLAGGWLQATGALEAGRLLKSRLLAGALRLDLDRVRQGGVGQLLGRVIESQALESLAASGGMMVLVAALELAFAAWILSRGAAPATHLLLLAAWLALTAGLAWRYARRLRQWTLARLDLTHELVEAMVGHRTRLAQERPGRRDAHEDQALQAYLQASRAMDDAAVPVFTAASAGWLLAALAGLVPAFMAGAPPTALAISLGGLLFAQRALAGMASGAAGLARAVVAWQQVSALFLAGRRQPDTTRPFLPAMPTSAPTVATAATDPPARPRAPSAAPGGAAAVTPLVDATGLSYAYAPRGERVLDNASLRILPGEHILLEGASGGGKSTLAALLAGLRTPQSGLLLLGGLDRHTLGDDWHRQVSAAPQFHENHVFTGTLAFNLLMGRRWPASRDDLQQAEALCRALGLGPLLDRMPGGMAQAIGETGWQLSHGERSRLFLARALLQGAPLTLMDESFAALDPETLETCLRCALAQAPTLLVVAHP